MVKTFGAFAVEMLHFLGIVMAASMRKPHGAPHHAAQRVDKPHPCHSEEPHPCHSEERSDVGIRIFLDRNLRKTQNLCVLETDCHASVYPKGTCFAARTGSQ